MDLIVITPENNVPMEQACIRELVDTGLSNLHVRKPFLNKQELEEYIVNLNINSQINVVVHNHPELAKKHNLNCNYRFSELKSDTKFYHSISVHAIEEFNQIDGRCEYALMSPVFNSISKTDYLQNKNLINAGKIKRKSKLIALGGISNNNLKSLIDAGFDGAAVLGAIWLSKKPVDEFIKLNKVIFSTSGI